MPCRRQERQRARLALWCCLALALVASSCGQQTPPDTRAADESAIRALDAQWEKAAAARDVDGTVSYYSDDAVVLPGNAPIVQGKEAIRTLWKSLLSPDISLSWQATKVDVARSGELAYLIGTYTLTAKDAQGKPATDHGKLVEIFKKKGDGPWKVAVDMYNSDLPAPPA